VPLPVSSPQLGRWGAIGAEKIALVPGRCGERKNGALLWHVAVYRAIFPSRTSVRSCILDILMRCLGQFIDMPALLRGYMGDAGRKESIDFSTSWESICDHIR